MFVAYANHSPRRALERWLTALRLRPALWLLPPVFLACAFGPLWARAFGQTAREDPICLLPAALGLACLIIAWRSRARFWSSRNWLMLSVFGLALTLAARSWLPPRADISQLLIAPSRVQPLQVLAGRLQGRVEGTIERNGSKTSFVLNCDAQSNRKYLQGRSGRVWVTIDGDPAVNTGDVVQAQGALLQLPRAGHASEADRGQRANLRGCWCAFESKNARVIGRDANSLSALIGGARRAILNRYTRAFTGDDERLGWNYGHATAQLLTAMTFGEGGLTQPLPRQVRDQFRRAGLTHILVASGAQVSIIALLCIGATRLLGGRGAWLAFLVVPPIVIYALIAGGAASIWRAALGGALVAWALGRGRALDAASLWCGALLILLVIDPKSLFDLSLQLSFGAMWGLIFLSPIAERALSTGIVWPQRWQWLRGVIALSIGAQLATLPILLHSFGRLSLAALGANIPAVPLAGVLIVSGGAGLFCPLLNGFNYALTRAIYQVTATCAAWSGAQIQTPPLRLAWTLVCALMLLILAACTQWPQLMKTSNDDGEEQTSWRESWRQSWQAAREEWQMWQRERIEENPASRPNRFSPLWLVVLATMMASAWLWRQWPRPARWNLTMLDVGQGECLLVRDPDGRAMLIDGGSSDSGRPDVGNSVIVPYLQSQGVEKLDALLITHSDSDHFNGLSQVAREVPIDRVFVTGTSIPALDNGATRAEEYPRLLAQLRASGAPLQALHGGETFALGQVKVRVLWPPENLSLKAASNSSSVVLRLDYQNTSALLTGDSEADVESALLNDPNTRRAVQNVTLLKVGHHGSRTSSTSAFLNAVNPRVALISCGRYNRFGHPTNEVLTRLAQMKIDTFRTDLDGTIEVSCAASTCEVNSAR